MHLYNYQIKVTRQIKAVIFPFNWFSNAKINYIYRPSICELWTKYMSVTISNKGEEKRKDNGRGKDGRKEKFTRVHFIIT